MRRLPRKILKKDILIPAGTIFDPISGGTTVKYGSSNFRAVIGLTKDSSGDLVYGVDPADSMLRDWFEDVNEIRIDGMQPFQKRVVDEKTELDDKINRMVHFIADSDIFPKLAEAERVRLRWQLVFMENYSKVLRERIEAF